MVIRECDFHTRYEQVAMLVPLDESEGSHLLEPNPLRCSF